MKSDWEFELKALQAAQLDLRKRLETLDERMAQLQTRLAVEDEPIDEVIPASIDDIPASPSLTEAVQMVDRGIVDPPLSNEGGAVSTTPPSLAPGALGFEAAGASKIEPLPPLPHFDTPAPEPSPVASNPPPASQAVQPDSAEGFELKVGKYWLVRIGVLVLLTGLVLLGNLAYQSFITHFGAVGKMALMFLGSAALLGIGFWLEKRVEKVRNYARVLMAGGAAAIYYTAYAAHFVASLRVIESPILAGAILLGLAGAFAWFAERRRAQGIAFTAILLAYYTSAINPAAQFTLFSNVLLTALAAFLLIRHQWFGISWLAVIGSYASFFYWRLGTVGSVDLWSSHGFLAAYWIIFTLAIFINRARAFPLVQRSFFLTVNNAAFFALSAPVISEKYPDEFWLFCLAFGVILLGLAALARRLKRDEPGFDGTYLAQGILMVTLGLICKFTGYQLGLILAVESAALLFLSRFRHPVLYQLFAIMAGVAAFALALESSPEFSRIGIAALLLANALQFKWIRQSFGRVDLGAAIFGLGGMVLVAVILGTRFGQVEWIYAFTLAGLIFSIAAYFGKTPEILAFAQMFPALALGQVINLGTNASTAPPFLISAVVLMHGWQHQRAFSPWVAKALEALYALAISGVVYFWLFKFGTSAEQLYVFLATGLGFLLYGCLLRVWPLALTSQIFTITGVYYYLDLLLDEPMAPWFVTLGGLALIAVQATLTRRIPQLQNGTARWLALGYRAVVALLGLLWLLWVMPTEWRSLALILVAGLLFIPAAMRRNSEYLFYAFGFGVMSLAACAAALAEPFSVCHLLTYAVWLLLQQMGRRLLAGSPYFPAVFSNGMSLVGVIGLWVEISRWAQQSETGMALTLVWALLAMAVLGLGFILRERSYRWMGLLILSVAVGQVFLIDVWKMGQLAGILSILGLAVILLLLGFVYNRFSEQIKKWL